jgi:hypothetical protein
MPGSVREVTVIDGRPQKERKISSLPSQFTDVQPLVLVVQDLSPPPLVGQLNKSGWTTVMANADVATPGVVDSFTSAKHITRTRRAHQITSSSLYVLQHRAYEKYITRAEDRVLLSFTDWRDKMSETCPHFLYWCRVMELQLICLQLVKAF